MKTGILPEDFQLTEGEADSKIANDPALLKGFIDFLTSQNLEIPEWAKKLDAVYDKLALKNAESDSDIPPPPEDTPPLTPTNLVNAASAACLSPRPNRSRSGSDS
jgi:uncharacterized coiled-coil protein SlyX